MSRSTDGGKHSIENGINACDICEKNDFRNEIDLITHKRTQHQVKPTNLSTKVIFLLQLIKFKNSEIKSFISKMFIR